MLAIEEVDKMAETLLMEMKELIWLKM